jgi:hypothetical protein
VIPVQSAVRYDDEVDFQACLTDPSGWFFLGESEQEAARVLLKEIVSRSKSKPFGTVEVYLFGQYFRHGAQAMEAWAKGILCCQRSLAKDDLHHSLTKLFAECGLNVARSGLLGKLEYYLQWASRYPTPRRATEAMTNHDYLCGYHDVELTHELMETVKGALVEERKKRGIGKGLFYASPNDDEIARWEELLNELTPG